MKLYESIYKGVDQRRETKAEHGKLEHSIGIGIVEMPFLIPGASHGK